MAEDLIAEHSDMPNRSGRRDTAIDMQQLALGSIGADMMREYAAIASIGFAFGGQNHAAGAIAEQYTGAAIGPVENACKGFGANRQGGLERPGLEHRIGCGQREQEARANGLNIKCSPRPRAELGLNRGRRGRESLVGRCGRQDEEIDRIGREAGIMTDLLGFGGCGALPNGEIAAFGSFLPFHSFGVGVYTNGTDVDLRMIYRPGAGEGQMPASTMEYIIDTGSGPISSGEIEFTNTEGGIPSGMPQDQFLALIGVGIQSQGNPGGSSNVTFTDFKVIPAPGTGLLALAGLGVVARRRRA